MKTEELKKLKPWTWLVFESEDCMKFREKYSIYYVLLYYGTKDNDSNDYVLFPIVLDMTDQNQTLLRSIRSLGELYIQSYSPGTFETWDENDYKNTFRDGLRVATRMEVKIINDFLKDNGVMVNPRKCEVIVPDEIEDSEFFDCSDLLKELN